VHAGAQPQPPASTPQSPARPALDEKTWAAFVHLAGFAGGVLPFGNIIGPLVIWLIKRQESDLVDRHGRVALNFQISATIYAFVCFILILVLIGIFLLLALAIFWLVMVIMAAVRASNGQNPGYVLTIRFVRRRQ
jgi:uncharacterized Tic20 family protein